MSCSHTIFLPLLFGLPCITTASNVLYGRGSADPDPPSSEHDVRQNAHRSNSKWSDDPSPFGIQPHRSLNGGVEHDSEDTRFSGGGSGGSFNTGDASWRSGGSGGLYDSATRHRRNVFGQDTARGIGRSRAMGPDVWEGDWSDGEGSGRYPGEGEGEISRAGSQRSHPCLHDLWLLRRYKGTVGFKSDINKSIARQYDHQSTSTGIRTVSKAVHKPESTTSHALFSKCYPPKCIKQPKPAYTQTVYQKSEPTWVKSKGKNEPCFKQEFMQSSWDTSAAPATLNRQLNVPYDSQKYSKFSPKDSKWHSSYVHHTSIVGHPESSLHDKIGYKLPFERNYNSEYWASVQTGESKLNSERSYPDRTILSRAKGAVAPALERDYTRQSRISSYKKTKFNIQHPLLFRGTEGRQLEYDDNPNIESPDYDVNTFRPIYLQTGKESDPMRRNVQNAETSKNHYMYTHPPSVEDTLTPEEREHTSRELFSRSHSEPKGPYGWGSHYDPRDLSEEYWDDSKPTDAGSYKTNKNHGGFGFNWDASKGQSEEKTTGEDDEGERAHVGTGAGANRKSNPWNGEGQRQEQSEAGVIPWLHDAESEVGFGGKSKEGNNEELEGSWNGFDESGDEWYKHANHWPENDANKDQGHEEGEAEAMPWLYNTEGSGVYSDKYRDRIKEGYEGYGEGSEDSYGHGNDRPDNDANKHQGHEKGEAEVMPWFYDTESSGVNTDKYRDRIKEGYEGYGEGSEDSYGHGNDRPDNDANKDQGDEKGEAEVMPWFYDTEGSGVYGVKYRDRIKNRNEGNGEGSEDWYGHGNDWPDNDANKDQGHEEGEAEAMPWLYNTEGSGVYSDKYRDRIKEGYEGYGEGSEDSYGHGNDRPDNDANKDQGHEKGEAEVMPWFYDTEGSGVNSDKYRDRIKKGYEGYGEGSEDSYGHGNDRPDNDANKDQGHEKGEAEVMPWLYDTEGNGVNSDKYRDRIKEGYEGYGEGSEDSYGHGNDRPDNDANKDQGDEKGEAEVMPWLYDTEGSGVYGVKYRDRIKNRDEGYGEGSEDWYGHGNDWPDNDANKGQGLEKGRPGVIPWLYDTESNSGYNGKDGDRNKEGYENSRKDFHESGEEWYSLRNNWPEKDAYKEKEEVGFRMFEPFDGDNGEHEKTNDHGSYVDKTILNNLQEDKKIATNSEPRVLRNGTNQENYEQQGGLKYVFTKLRRVLAEVLQRVYGHERNMAKEESSHESGYVQNAYDTGGVRTQTYNSGDINRIKKGNTDYSYGGEHGLKDLHEEKAIKNYGPDQMEKVKDNGENTGRWEDSTNHFDENGGDLYGYGGDGKEPNATGSEERGGKSEEKLLRPEMSSNGATGIIIHPGSKYSKCRGHETLNTSHSEKNSTAHLTGEEHQDESENKHNLPCILKDFDNGHNVSGEAANKTYTAEYGKKRGENEGSDGESWKDGHKGIYDLADPKKDRKYGDEGELDNSQGDRKTTPHKTKVGGEEKEKEQDGRNKQKEHGRLKMFGEGNPDNYGNGNSEIPIDKGTSGFHKKKEEYGGDVSGNVTVLRQEMSIERDRNEGGLENFQGDRKLQTHREKSGGRGKGKEKKGREKQSNQGSLKSHGIGETANGTNTGALGNYSKEREKGDGSSTSDGSENVVAIEDGNTIGNSMNAYNFGPQFVFQVFVPPQYFQTYNNRQGSENHEEFKDDEDLNNFQEDTKTTKEKTRGADKGEGKKPKGGHKQRAAVLEEVQNHNGKTNVNDSLGKAKKKEGIVITVPRGNVTPNMNDGEEGRIIVTYLDGSGGVGTRQGFGGKEELTISQNENVRPINVTEETGYVKGNEQYSGNKQGLPSPFNVNENFGNGSYVHGNGSSTKVPISTEHEKDVNGYEGSDIFYRIHNNGTSSDLVTDASGVVQNGDGKVGSAQGEETTVTLRAEEALQNESVPNRDWETNVNDEFEKATELEGIGDTVSKGNVTVNMSGHAGSDASNRIYYSGSSSGFVTEASYDAHDGDGKLSTSQEEETTVTLRAEAALQNESVPNHDDDTNVKDEFEKATELEGIGVTVPQGNVTVNMSGHAGSDALNRIYSSRNSSDFVTEGSYDGHDGNGKLNSSQEEETTVTLRAEADLQNESVPNRDGETNVKDEFEKATELEGIGVTVPQGNVTVNMSGHAGSDALNRIYSSGNSSDFVREGSYDAHHGDGKLSTSQEEETTVTLRAEEDLQNESVPNRDGETNVKDEFEKATELEGIGVTVPQGNVTVNMSGHAGSDALNRIYSSGNSSDFVTEGSYDAHDGDGKLRTSQEEETTVTLRAEEALQNESVPNRDGETNVKDEFEKATELEGIGVTVPQGNVTVNMSGHAGSDALNRIYSSGNSSDFVTEGSYDAHDGDGKLSASQEEETTVTLRAEEALQNESVPNRDGETNVKDEFEKATELEGIGVTVPQGNVTVNMSGHAGSDALNRIYSGGDPSDLVTEGSYDAHDGNGKLSTSQEEETTVTLRAEAALQNESVPNHDEDTNVKDEFEKATELEGIGVTVPQGNVTVNMSGHAGSEDLYRIYSSGNSRDFVTEGSYDAHDGYGKLSTSQEEETTVTLRAEAALQNYSVPNHDEETNVKDEFEKATELEGIGVTVPQGNVTVNMSGHAGSEDLYRIYSSGNSSDFVTEGIYDAHDGDGKLSTSQEEETTVLLRAEEALQNESVPNNDGETNVKDEFEKATELEGIGVTVPQGNVTVNMSGHAGSDALNRIYSSGNSSDFVTESSYDAHDGDGKLSTSQEEETTVTLRAEAALQNESVPNHDGDTKFNDEFEEAKELEGIVITVPQRNVTVNMSGHAVSDGLYRIYSSGNSSDFVTESSYDAHDGDGKLSTSQEEETTVTFRAEAALQNESVPNHDGDTKFNDEFEKAKELEGIVITVPQRNVSVNMSGHAVSDGLYRIYSSGNSSDFVTEGSYDGHDGDGKLNSSQEEETTVTLRAEAALQNESVPNHDEDTNVKDEFEKATELEGIGVTVPQGNVTVNMSGHAGSDALNRIYSSGNSSDFVTEGSYDAHDGDGKLSTSQEEETTVTLRAEEALQNESVPNRDGETNVKDEFEKATELEGIGVTVPQGNVTVNMSGHAGSDALNRVYSSGNSSDFVTEGSYDAHDGDGKLSTSQEEETTVTLRAEEALQNESVPNRDGDTNVNDEFENAKVLEGIGVTVPQRNVTVNMSGHAGSDDLYRIYKNRNSSDFVTGGSVVVFNGDGTVSSAQEKETTVKPWGEKAVQSEAGRNHDGKTNVKAELEKEKEMEGKGVTNIKRSVTEQQGFKISTKGEDLYGPLFGLGGTTECTRIC